MYENSNQRKCSTPADASSVRGRGCAAQRQDAALRAGDKRLGLHVRAGRTHVDPERACGARRAPAARTWRQLKLHGAGPATTIAARERRATGGRCLAAARAAARGPGARALTCCRAAHGPAAGARAGGSPYSPSVSSSVFSAMFTLISSSSSGLGEPRTPHLVCGGENAVYHPCLCATRAHHVCTSAGPPSPATTRSSR
jgi:hypothetical protein